MTLDVYALDFDGVLCDSCGESSKSALKAAIIRWPGLFQDMSAEVEDWILMNMRYVRPVVETGYENILLVRLLLEIRIPRLRTSVVPETLSVDDILLSWGTLRPSLLQAWNGDKDEMVHFFGEVRDKWIQDDFKGWLEANRFYPGTAEALRFASSPVFIVTTKQTRFAHALLKELAGIDFPIENIYGLGTGPKVEVLQQLQSRAELSSARFHFVEDRLATLKNVMKTSALDGWEIYLGDWGYNTESEREEASKLSRIQILDLSNFCTKLK